jgi:hypothetical protein
MKNKKLYLGMLVIVLVFGMMVVGCDPLLDDSGIGRTIALELEGDNILVFTLSGDWEWKNPPFSDFKRDIVERVCKISGSDDDVLCIGQIQTNKKILKVTVTANRGFPKTITYTLKDSGPTAQMDVTNWSSDISWTANANKKGPITIIITEGL